MIGISTIVFDLEGAFILHDRDAQVVLGSMGRRGSKSATLDGGISVYDTGLSHGDREFKAKLSNPSASFIDRIKSLMESHSTFRVTTREGVFTAALSSLNETSSNPTLTISIEEKLD